MNHLLEYATTNFVQTRFTEVGLGQFRGTDQQLEIGPVTPVARR